MHAQGGTMVQILGICGSARKNGNTATLLQAVLDAAGLESELVFLSDKNIGFCSGCMSCVKHKGVCVKNDDMQELLQKMLGAQALVLGSPNYYYDVSGLMKNMIDRSIAASYLGIGEYTGMAWHGWHPFAGKAGGIVICQAAFGAEKALETFKCFADYSGLHLVGEVIAATGNQPVRDFPEYIAAAKKLGDLIRKAALDKLSLRQ
jgi:multimeric flavodoxin WrbA